MNARTVAIACLIVLVLIVGALVSIPILIREPVPVARPGAPITLVKQGGPLSVSGQFIVERDARFAAVLVFPSGKQAPGQPRVLLEMPNSEMMPIEAQVSRVDDGRFAASGILHSFGRWSMTIELDGQHQSFDFVAVDF